MCPEKLNPVLTDGELTLRLLKKEDIELYYNAFFAKEDEEVLRLTATEHHYTREQVCAYLQSIEDNPSRYDFLIQIGETLLGEIVLNEITEEGHAGFRIALFQKKFFGQGIGQKAIKLLLHFAFETLELQKIELEVLTHNTRAKHVYEKLGFQVERILPGEYSFHGERFDAYLMRLSRGSFLEKKAKDLADSAL